MIETEDRKQILYLSLVLILTINFLHIWAISNYFYWLYWWFDMLMHFLGGLWVGVTLLWAYSLVFNTHSFDKKKTLFYAFLALLVVVFSWEVFELFIQNNLNEQNFLSDTLSDMLLGIVGGSVAYRYFTFNFLKS